MGKDVAANRLLGVDLEGHSSAGISSHLVGDVDDYVVFFARIVLLTFLSAVIK